ncbi:MAG: UDP-N-acetylmuramate dehydrogenase [Treponema sp.]|jgi:UDP-N-acetylmuramate dehydrogenase|nr:UDP-N-acetylmuramate dehydrogenase [Treponema sp.]
MPTLAEFYRNFNRQKNFDGVFRFDEPMAAHTTFKTGGPADVWVRPEGGAFPEYSGELILSARKEGIPVFILGGGANIVVSENGIRGIVLDTGGYRGIRREPGDIIAVEAGAAVDDAVEFAASSGLSGLEFLAAMPGSTGGALWMNARCYEKSVSDVLAETEILDLSGPVPIRTRVPRREAEFGYKKSPFQSLDALILGGRFALKKGERSKITGEMETRRLDREAKGHFRFPSAGSVFKNNRDFGKPAGKIIDELGLRGLSVGDAQVAPWHGNIIINLGNAGGSDIKALAELVRDRVRAAAGLELEYEVLFAGF